MYKIILSYTVNGQPRMKRYLAAENALSVTMNKVCDQIAAFAKTDVKFMDVNVSVATEAEAEQIGADVLPEVIALLKQCPSVTAITRDTCPFYAKDAKSIVTIYAMDYTESVLSLKKYLFNFYNAKVNNNDCYTDIQIKHDEDPDLTQYHLIPGIDY